MACLFFCFHTVPFLQGVFFSFTDWKGYGEWDLVGLRNYLHIFKDKNVVYSYLFTFKFAIVATVLVNVLSLALACGLNANIKGKNFLKAVYFLPYMLGTLIISYVFKYIFANIVPLMGKTLGKDATQNKLTFVSLYGLEKAKSIAQQLIQEAKEQIHTFGPKALVLEELADFIIQRNH